METTVNNTRTYIYNSVDLKNEIVKTIESIEEWCKSKNYRIKRDITNFKFEVLRVDNLYDLSHTQKKKINKYIFLLNCHMTMKRVNSFFTLIHRLLTTTNSVNPIKVMVSEKEEKIQLARKKMMEAKQNYESLLKIYKEEKGDFYK